MEKKEPCSQWIQSGRLVLIVTEGNDGIRKLASEINCKPSLGKSSFSRVPGLGGTLSYLYVCCFSCSSSSPPPPPPLPLLLQFLLLHIFFISKPRSGELRTQKLKSHLVRTQSLNVLPLKPGIAQCIDIYATLTARDFFLTYSYPSGPFACIFSKPLPIFFLCWLWLTPVPV